MDPKDRQVKRYYPEQKLWLLTLDLVKNKLISDGWAIKSASFFQVHENLICTYEKSFL